jgi:hypothetical protein
MRHVVVVLILAAAAVLAWRIQATRAAGGAMHAREVAARAMADKILRAEEQRRLDLKKLGASNPTGPTRYAPYEFLSGLVSEQRVDGLRAVAAGEREVFFADGYLFHVRLLNRLDRPLPRPSPELSLEPQLGEKFELWAWPADADDVSLAVFFGSQGMLLLQGENGSYAGVDARPEDVVKPIKQIQNGPNDTWIEVAEIPRNE